MSLPTYLLTWVADVAPIPSPGPVRQLDPDQVSPGLLGLASFLFLVAAVYVIWRSMNRQIKRIDFDETGTGTAAVGGSSPDGPKDGVPKTPERNDQTRS